MPAKASPTSMRLMPIELAPIAWMTRSIVPALASQSASVSGISSPFGDGSTRTNWPACAALAISGDCTVNSTMPLGEIDLLEDGLRRLAEVGVARGALDQRP